MRTEPNDATTDIQRLRDTVNTMDNMSQEGFGQISAIARIALRSLEAPDGHRHINDIVQALEAIAAKADDIESCINYTAEVVGCNYTDDGAKRRQDAAFAYRAQAARERDELLRRTANLANSSAAAPH